MLKLISKLYVQLAGWKAVGRKPEVKKCVMIAAPHTSNWDFPITMAILNVLDARFRFLGKKELFRFPLGIIMRFFGGMPVDRTKKGKMVDSMIEKLQQSEELLLMIPVEGTRGYVKEWKSGFYHAALGAGVPIALGFLDYAKKEGGIMEELFYPSGNYEEDLKKIKTIYKEITARHPELSSLKDFQA
ncbi:MAG: lysophospholipid acyltransferase family protein [Verrucomicrobia bacterium]|nr:lysophospholipid acyltransferase family protein [Cytophagales bacterium]